MPFGIKAGPDGQPVNFNRVYAEYIAPALASAGMTVLRADEEARPGDIRTDMFQELLLADLVVADLTVENANVWYELGVRHALRARGVVLVCGGKVTTAFDLYTDRKLRYGLKNGAPDPATLDADKEALTKVVKATMESWHGRITSPVYHLLPNLQEPDWKSLRIGDVREFWDQHDAWLTRVELARKAREIGDVLVLAQEAPVAAFRAEAWIKAGQALRKAGRFEFALEQLEQGLKIEPCNLTGLREKGTCLERLALARQPGYSLDRAREHDRAVLKDYPNDAETWALLGRVDKDAWIEGWRKPGKTPPQMRDEAADQAALLRAAISSYQKGYCADPAHYYSGINALTLIHLHRHLTGDHRYDRLLDTLPGAVSFAAECEPDERQTFWAAATRADIEVLIGSPESVKAAYQEAIARNDKDWFALDSSRSQLELLKDLDFRPPAVAAGLATVEKALQGLVPPAPGWQPRQVVLFSGHMVDAPGRATPRFPPAKEPIAARKIAETLEQLHAGPDDLALTQGACGGDLLFTEACLQRGVKVCWLLPLREPEFLENSVERAGPMWRERYFEAKAKLAAPPRIAPDELGEPPANSPAEYTYERCNRWLLYTAMAYGNDRLRFICLWDGRAGDGPGGTAHMYEEVRRRTGRVEWIDTRNL